MASPGDLIAFNRGTYQHYALYTGNGRVINIGAEDIFETRALISELLIEDVAGDSRARIENQGEYAAFHFRKRAAYPREILRRAKMHVGAYLPYEFMFRNCEYYCTLWRFGVGFSAQVRLLHNISIFNSKLVTNWTIFWIGYSCQASYWP